MVTRRAVGTVVLVLGWSAVAAAGVLIGLGATGRASSRDEVVGSGLALLMAGMLVVVLGNYVHHQTPCEDDDDVSIDDDRCGGVSRPSLSEPEHETSMGEGPTPASDR